MPVAAADSRRRAARTSGPSAHRSFSTRFAGTSPPDERSGADQL